MITLHRAIVTISGRLCTQGRSVQERIVFFEAPCEGLQSTFREACYVLERLLHAAWNVDTAGWCELGTVWDIKAHHELLARGTSSGDLRLLELGWSGVSPVFAKAENVDAFVTPRWRLKLDAAWRRLEDLQQQPGSLAA